MNKEDKITERDLKEVALLILNEVKKNNDLCSKGISRYGNPGMAIPITKIFKKMKIYRGSTEKRNCYKKEFDGALARLMKYRYVQQDDNKNKRVFKLTSLGYLKLKDPINMPLEKLTGFDLMRVI